MEWKSVPEAFYVVSKTLQVQYSVPMVFLQFQRGKRRRKVVSGKNIGNTQQNPLHNATVSCFFLITGFDNSLNLLLSVFFNAF